MSEKKLKVTLVKSGIGYNVKQKRTLRALGLHKLNQSVYHTDQPAVQGMIKRVEHLVSVEEVENDETA